MKKLLLAITILLNCNSISAQTALNFDGVNDFVLGTNNTSLNLTQGTLEAWIKPATASDYRGVIVKYSSYAYYLFNNILIVWDGVLWQAVSSGYHLNGDTWYHVAFAFNNSITNGSKLYVNGLPIFTFTYNVQINTSNIVAGAGHFRLAPPSQSFQGNIDQVRVWNTVKTDAEILANYNKCLVGNETGLVMLWQFEEGTGTSVMDQSGNNNNGTLINMDSATDWVTGYSCTTLSNEDIDKDFTNLYICNSILHIKNTQNLTEIKTVEVYNLLGQKVFKTSEIKAQISLNINQAGMYILKVENLNGNFSTLKFLIN